MLKLFWNEENGGLYYYGNTSEKLILRPKDIYDGAIPSGNGISVLNFAKLYRITGDKDFQLKQNAIFKCFGKDINQNPIAHIYSILSLME